MCFCSREDWRQFDIASCEDLPWAPTRPHDVECATAMCEVHVVITTRQEHEAIRALLVYDKRASGARGRSLAADMCQHGLRKFDRLNLRGHALTLGRALTNCAMALGRCISHSGGAVARQLFDIETPCCQFQVSAYTCSEWMYCMYCSRVAHRFSGLARSLSGTSSLGTCGMLLGCGSRHATQTVFTEPVPNLCLGINTCAGRGGTSQS